MGKDKTEMDYSRDYRIYDRDRSEQDGQEIDLKDLLFYILYRWRSLLLIAALAGILAGGYADRYNRGLPEKRTQMQRELEEQQRLVKEGKEKQQSVNYEQKKVEELQKGLDGLKERGVVKYGIIGIVGGIAILAFGYGFLGVFHERTLGEREILERYGHYLLGTLPRRRGRKRKELRGLDRLIAGKEGVSGRLTREEAYRIIAANITNLAKEGGVFLVTGTVGFEKIREFTQTLTPMLQKNTKLTAGADMNTTAETLKKLAECDAVILVEEREKSVGGEIRKELECAAALKKPVLGYVVV